MELEPCLAEQLRALEQLLIDRDIAAGFALLEQVLAGLPSQPAAAGTEETAPLLLFLLSQWVDLGFGDWQVFDAWLSRLNPPDLRQLPVLGFFQLQVTQAVRLIASQSLSEPIAMLDALLRAGHDVMPPFLLFVCHFWRGRAHRLEGQYELALQHIRQAREIAGSMHADKLEAVTKIHESWLVFHRGDKQQANRLLDDAEAQLASTEHTLSLGNIAAARGRFARTSGDYPRALEHFEAAIRLYEPRHAHHPSHARALVNAAYVKRLMALDLQPRTRGGVGKAAMHARSLAIMAEAVELLRLAGSIYAPLQHQAGTGSVLINLGHLQLESGNMEEAAQEAQTAYTLGESKHDLVLMARARILQASVELAFSDEGVDEEVSSAVHARLALQYADDAVNLAQETKNRRLLAGACIVRGQVAADPFFMEWETAREYANRSTQLLPDEDRDHLNRELKKLKSRIARSTAVDEMLRLWSEGEVGDKSFQQVQEEFAELVIPKVWLRAGKNVSLVAQMLSISPKKVRRIIRSARSTESKPASSG